MFISFFNKIFEVPLYKKANNIKLPKFIFKCTNEEIAAFIRGLFDCDSYVSNSKKEINIILASKELINQLNILLLRFGIHSRYSERIKWVAGNKEKTRKLYYSLSISVYENLSLYDKYIGFNSNFKKKRVVEYLKKEGNTNVDVIPCGRLIREIRKNSRTILPRDTHKKLWQYESEKIHPSNGKLREIIKLFNSHGIDVPQLDRLINNDIFWDKIKSINRVEVEKEVYDITVPGASNFVSNGFIIHNSTMMNLVGSLDLATQGNIYLDGKDIEHLDESQLAQIRGRKIGFIFQSFNLIPNLTAKENVMLPMLFHGKDKFERSKKA